MPPKAKGHTDALARARSSFASYRWKDAYTAFETADRETPLAPEDLERFASVAHMLGLSLERDALGVRAHQAFVDCHDAEGAARAAFWIGFGLFTAGERARGGGWLARAQRLLGEAGIDSVVSGYLLLPQAMHCSHTGELTQAFEAFSRAIEIGKRFDDQSLVTFGRLGVGRTMIKRGEIAEGMSLLDEVMVAATSNEVSETLVGVVYCSTVDACYEVFDMRRAQEWTNALTAWCDARPDVAVFRGQCLIHRAELKQLHGDWTDAMDEARRACEWLADPPGHPAAGAANYRRAELHRLRGMFEEAEAGYRASSECGRQPHPGLALLWLAQGKTDAAVAAIRRLVGERQDVRTRAAVLEASSEILVAANDLTTADVAVRELSEFATRVGAPYLLAASSLGRGRVLLASGDAPAALAELRDAWTRSQALGAPFEAARARVLIALAHRALGDEGTASIELDAARHAFEELGAAPELARINSFARSTAAHSDELTGREVEVLKLIASGKTNRAIASKLGISEKTVARHVSNIFVKLNLSNRSAATAYAYEHKLQDAAPT